MTSNDVTLDGPVDELDIDTKKLKQTPEDKRRRNYIAVRKHRQQLKETLEQCPVRLVELQKEFRNLLQDEQNKFSALSGLEELYKSAEAKRTQGQSNGGESRTSPDVSTVVRLESKRRSPSPSGSEVEIVEEEMPTMKRPKRVYPGGVPEQRISPQLANSSPLFTSPLLQPQIFTPTFPAFLPNLMSSPLLQPQFPLVSPLFLQNTPATPMQSPVQMQPFLTLAPDLLQGMVSHDLLQNVTGAVRTAPINFTQDNVDFLWKLCNEQLG